MKRLLWIPHLLLIALSMMATSPARGQTAETQAPETQAPETQSLRFLKTSPSAPAEKLKLPGVRNAGKVSLELYRGGQPSEHGFAELKKLGISTIVNLRGNRGDSETERVRAEALGMHYVDIPVKAWAAPTDAQVARFLKLLRDAPGQKVFVHCLLGEDRSGVMVATFRMAQQGWTSDQALSEMDSFGFHYRLDRSMKRYVRKFPAKLEGSSVFASIRTQK